MQIGFSSDTIMAGVRNNSDNKPEGSPVQTLRSWLLAMEAKNMDVKNIEFACHSLNPKIVKELCVVMEKTVPEFCFLN